MFLLILHRKTFKIIIKKQSSLIAREKDKRRRQQIKRIF